MANELDFGTGIALIKGLGGKPTDEQVTTAVDAWLDAHPEATTTVEDGSISYAKLNSSLKGTVDDVGDLKTHITNLSNAVEMLDEGSLSASAANLGEIPLANGDGTWSWKELGYVTPEMYGAVGDGVADDTTALQDALDSGKAVRAENAYKITDTITIGDKSIVNISGIIVYAGARTKPAVKVTGSYNEVCVNTIIDTLSYAATGYDGGWHGWESNDYAGMLVYNAQYNSIYVDRIINFTAGISIVADNGGNFKNNISGNTITNCKYGIYLYTSGEDGWMNSTTINGFLINTGASTSDISINSNSINTYGVYQDIGNNAYGCRYMVFNRFVFEVMTHVKFTGFYFKLIANSKFCNTVSEIQNGATFSEFYIYKTTSGDISTTKQYSYNNRFENTGFMGGNAQIVFSGDKKASITSLKKVACFDTDKWMEIFSDNSFYGKALTTNSTKTQSVVKGYSFTATRFTGTLDNAKNCRTEDGRSYNDTTNKVLSQSARHAISLMLPVNNGESYRVDVQGSKTTNASVMLKTYASDGSFLTPTTSSEKLIAGNFVVDTTVYNSYIPFSSNIQSYEFTVVDDSVAYVIVMVYGMLSGFSISSCDATNPIVHRHWGILDYLNFAGTDKFVTNAIPSSTTDSDDTLYIGQRLYDGRSLAQLGAYWEYTSSGWVYSN